MSNSLALVSTSASNGPNYPKLCEDVLTTINITVNQAAESVTNVAQTTIKQLFENVDTAGNACPKALEKTGHELQVLKSKLDTENLALDDCHILVKGENKEIEHIKKNIDNIPSINGIFWVGFVFPLVIITPLTVFAIKKIYPLIPINHTRQI